MNADNLSADIKNASIKSSKRSSFSKKGADIDGKDEDVPSCAGSVIGGPTGPNSALHLRVSELKETINQKREAIANAESELVEIMQPSTHYNVTTDKQIALPIPTQEALKDTLLKHSALAKELAALDRTKAKTKPEYDHVLRNYSKRDMAEKLKVDIVEHEEKVALTEIEAKDLEQKLVEASLLYKKEVEKRNEFMMELRKSLADLAEAINHKLILTTVVDEPDEVVYPTNEHQVPSGDINDEKNASRKKGSDEDDESDNASTTSSNNNTISKNPTTSTSHSPQKTTTQYDIDVVLNRKKMPPRPKPEEYVHIDANDVIEILCNTTKTRCRHLSSLEKLAREHKCMSEINAEKMATLTETAERNVSTLKFRKDEAIYQAVRTFQDERNKLHVDISDMKKVNKEQSLALRSGDREKKKERGAFGKKSQPNINNIHNKELQMERILSLESRNTELSDEINIIRDEIRKATKTKAELLRETKQIDLKMRREGENNELLLAKMQTDLNGTKLAVDRVEMENEKMAKQVDAFNKQVKYLLKQGESNATIRTRALPIE
eukprot:Tbor_TRINITY_DN5886_c4_g1::TRINITY_DN5886_c4_g1_i1::g.6909::m.6909